MVTLLATGSAAIFTSVALITKHDHWQLEGGEAKALSEALNDALNTLPVKYYDQITSVIEKWVPWVNLAFVAGAIIVPRIEESTKRIEATRYQSVDSTTERGNGRATPAKEAGPFDNFTSLGWSG